MKISNYIKWNLISIISLLLFLIIWQSIVFLNFDMAILFSSPSLVITKITNLVMYDNLVNHLFSTFFLLLLSILSSLIFWFILAFLSFKSKKFYESIKIYIYILNSIPIVALIPLFIIWFWFWITSKIITVSIIILPIFFISFFDAFNRIEKDYIMLGNSLKLSKLSFFKNITFYSILPSTLISLRLSIWKALIGVTLAELYWYGKWLGYLLNMFSISSNVSWIASVIVLLLTLNFALLTLLKTLEKYFFKHY